jgi:CubicO group peptidase (beta-lactamase class C family)
VTTRRNVLVAGVSLAAARVLAEQQGDWDSTSAGSAGLRASAVEDTLRAGESVPGLRALLVARRGVLVAERYYGGATAESLLALNSATKSICSLLVGLALSEGRLKSLDDTVAQLIPESLAEVPTSPAAGITLRQILSGRTGFDRDWRRWREIEKAQPLVPYVLSRPGEPTAEPNAWTYNDAMVSLIAPILRRAQGVDLADLATRQLFRPLNIERHVWDRDEDGNYRTPRGLVLRPRDLLKFAAMMANGGRWRGVQVVPESWVAESLKPLGPSTWRTGPVSDVGYGLLWFTGRLHGHQVAWAWGYAAQFSLLVPELGLAVASAAASKGLSIPDAGKQASAVMTLVGRMVESAA